MKRIAAAFLTGILCFGVYSQVDTSKQHFWMMTYFLNSAESGGARLAFSSDTTGAQWQKYNGEAAIITPSASVGALMRDPMIAYDSVNRRFNMVWTVAWTGTTIGWDTSSLLKAGTWGPQVALNVGASVNAAFSWAPEVLWDDIQSKWMIYWSCSITGSNHRIMSTSVTGTNFANFSTPTVILNTGYSIIDADIIKVGTGSYRMFFKREVTGYLYVLRIAGTTPQVWDQNTISGPLTALGGDSPNRAEGPTCFKQGNEYHLITDHYSQQGLKIVRMKNIDTTTSPMPEAYVYYGGGTNVFTGSHCNVIEVPKRYVLWMLYNIPLPTVGVKSMPAIKRKTELYGSEIKLFDLSGRMVAIERLKNGDGSLSKSLIGRLPAGVLIKAVKNSNGLVATKVVPNM